MSALPAAFVTFASTFGCAMIATYVRSRLPPAHLSKESQDVVRLGIGLVATMTALLLGLVTAAARSTFDAQDTGLKNSAIAILTLDRHLARYGPETRGTRELVRRAVAFRLETTWGEHPSMENGIDDPGSTPPVEEIENQILALAPQTDTQRWLKSEALKLTQEVVKARWRVLSASGAVPAPFLAVVMFWLTVTFTSFGLYAPRNATVVAVLLTAAASVALAVFLILELDGPLDGFIKVSSASFRYVLAQLGQ
jgi:hypothetical protein